MTFQEFQATAAPISDELWAIVQEEAVDAGQPREAFTMYGGEYVMHRQDGKFWPHAWWYAPAPKPTQLDAELVLWEWRKEWV